MGTMMSKSTGVHPFEKSNIGQRIFIGVIIIGALIIIGRENFLLFHTGVELFSIVIALIIFIVALHTQGNGLLIFGISYGFIAFFDLLHTISYKGMVIFPSNDADLPTQLWIISRYIESIYFLLGSYLYNKKLDKKTIFLIYNLISIILLIFVFKWDIFPSCYIENQGLTLFKILSEMIICIIIAIAIIRLVHIRSQLNQRVYWKLIKAYVFTILSEISFVFYTDVYEFSNIIGHIFKLISFYYIYKSIVREGLLTPYEKMYRRERELNCFVQGLPQAIFVLQDNRIINANEPASQILGGLSFESMKDRDIFDFILPMDSNHDKLYPGEQRIKTFNGKELDVDILKSKYTFSDEVAEIVVLHDLTYRKKVENLSVKLAKEEKRLEEVIESSRIKTDFFSNASHEFKTPLNVILGTVQLMELNIENTATNELEKKEKRKMLKVMKQNCYRLLRLVNNLIDMSKIESKYMSIKMYNKDIVSVVEDIVISVSDYVKGKGINLIFDTDVEERVIACDPDSIERIILNLLSNAIKFMDSGGSIFVDILDGDKYLTIKVRDTGIGIPQKKLRRIFEKFMQVDESLSRNSEGSGIGLYLVKSLVEMHEGSVDISSQEGVGTEFSMKLPIRTIEDYIEEDYKYLAKPSKVERIDIEFSDIYSIY